MHVALAVVWLDTLKLNDAGFIKSSQSLRPRPDMSLCFRSPLVLLGHSSVTSNAVTCKMRILKLNVSNNFVIYSMTMITQTIMMTNKHRENLTENLFKFHIILSNTGVKNRRGYAWSQPNTPRTFYFNEIRYGTSHRHRHGSCTW